MLDLHVKTQVSSLGFGTELLRGDSPASFTLSSEPTDGFVLMVQNYGEKEGGRARPAIFLRELRVLSGQMCLGLKVGRRA